MKALREWNGKRIGRFRTGFRLARISLLMVLLSLVATLNYWSHQGDPRFFQFLQSPVGSACAQVFGWWRSPLERPIVEKADHQLTREERNVKAVLERAVSRQAPEAVVARPLTVRYRDILFRREFPGDPMYLDPPYAIVSDLDGFQVERTMETVRRVHRDFLSLFHPLFTRSPEDELIHMLYFASRDRYELYQSEAAREMTDTSGFYSPTVNRLVLYHAGHDEGETCATIRHEAAHQLFFTYGIHSIHRIENEWLIEGLASYCETDRIGAVDSGQVRMLRQALESGRTIPVEELVNHRSDGGLLAYKPAELAYAQAWSLVHLLMQEPTREAFFAYIRELRRPEAFASVRGAPRIENLCAALGMTPRELQETWEDYVRVLATYTAHSPSV